MSSKDVIQVPRLQPKDLYDKRIRRDHARLRAYNALLEQIYHRVYSTSQLSGNTSSVLYSVPPFILGLPKLDMEDCVVYIVWQLRQAGFEVRFTWPNILYISWKHHEGDYLANKNPIVQAMAPSSQRPAPEPVLKPRKEPAAPAAKPLETRYFNDAFTREIDIITSIPSSKKAIDYQPPASFVQNLDRPGPGREQKTGAKGNILADLWTI